MHESFLTGMAAARATHARIMRRGTKWKNRRIPIFIREHLLVPYYLTEIDGKTCLFAIQEPTEKEGKVAFACVAARDPDGQYSAFPAGLQSSGPP